MSKKATATSKTKTKVTRIKAQADAKPAKPTAAKPAAKTKIKPVKSHRPAPKLLRPLAKLGNYFKQSFLELRQVKWPTRKETWSMTLAVIAYAVILTTAVLILDNFFKWGFKLIIK